MYALKFVSNEGIHNYSLGGEYHIQREDPRTSDSPVAIVHGEDPARGWDVRPGSDAYITTMDGKTVEVVHRICWPS